MRTDSYVLGHLLVDVVTRICDMLEGAKPSTMKGKIKIYAKKIKYEKDLEELVRA